MHNRQLNRYSTAFYCRTGARAARYIKFSISEAIFFFFNRRLKSRVYHVNLFIWHIRSLNAFLRDSKYI